MNNFFQTQLKRFFDNKPEFANAEYVGRAIYVDLGNNMKLKAQFVTRSTIDKYEALKMYVYNNDHDVDTLQLNFEDYFEKQENAYGDKILPHMWKYRDLEWYRYPTSRDIRNLTEAACEFARLYATPEIKESWAEERETTEAIESYHEQIDDVMSEYDYWEDVDVTPSFQSDVTLGCPTVLCVCWDAEKAWVAPTDDTYDEMTVRELRPYERACADFGIRDCSTAEEYNNLLKELGNEAEEYCIADDGEDETDDLTLTM